MKENIVLIGMPGAGKSSVGVVLAKAMGYNFLDSDILIQQKLGKRLFEIIENVGKEEFNKIEGTVNKGIDVSRHVIATGGSAIYDEGAMKHFKNIGKIVFLNLSLSNIEKRLGNISERGISMKPGETIADLYEERLPLYQKYADCIINSDGMSIKQTMEAIVKAIEK